jgi:hypothetical protein
MGLVCTCVETNKQTNKPVELTLKEGGTTKVRNLKDIDSKGQLKINEVFTCIIFS